MDVISGLSIGDETKQALAAQLKVLALMPPAAFLIKGQPICLIGGIYLDDVKGSKPQLFETSQAVPEVRERRTRSQFFAFLSLWLLGLQV